MPGHATPFHSYFEPGLLKVVAATVFASSSLGANQDSDLQVQDRRENAPLR